MAEHHYDVAGDKMNSSKANHFLIVIVSIVIAVGVVISLLSLFVLMLSIYQLLQKNTCKLQDLLLLGCSPSQVARPYMRLVVVINATVLVLAIVLMLWVRMWYQPMLYAFGVAGAGVMPAIAVGVLIMSPITAGNLLAIRRKVAALWPQ